MGAYVVPPRETPQLAQLTSVRGVACVAVVFGHAIQMVRYVPSGSSGGARALEWLICGAFNAEAAVTMFFVLSGCVLSLSLQRAQGLGRADLAGFYIKRVFRIYPMLWVSTPIAIVAVLVARGGAGAVFADWLARNLASPITPWAVGLSLLGAYTRLNGPMWSLRAELLYSAILPFLLRLLRRPAARWGVAGAFGVLAALPTPHEYGLSFGLSFMLGALVALRSGRALHGGVAVGAVFVLLYARPGLAGLGLADRYFDMVESVASYGIVDDLVRSGRRHRLLTARPMLWIGEVSYSVYLLHLPFMLIVYAALRRKFPGFVLVEHPFASPAMLGGITMATVFVASSYSHRLVEAPMQRLGRRLAGGVAAGVWGRWRRSYP